MNYLIDLTKEEIKYVCTVIPFKEVSAYFRRYPKEFTKLKPGFRVKSLNEDTVSRTLYDFRNRDFIASFLIKHIDRWIEEIDEELAKALENGLDQEAAYVDVLSRSFFSGNVALFFKIKGEEKSEDYLKVIGYAVFYQSAHQKTEEEFDFLKKRHLELTGIQEELKNRISDEEKKVEKLRKKEEELKSELKEKIEQLEQEQEKNTRLSEKADKLEAELKKNQDDEVWKTVEMQQKIDTLTSRLKDQAEKAAGYETSISEYESRLSSAEDDIETWKNKVRSREKQLFTYKAERATFLTDQESNRKQIRELKDALDKALGVEKVYKECLSALSTEKESYLQKNKELEETLEAQRNIETAAEAVSKRYAHTSCVYKSNVGANNRSQKIFYEIACECGLGKDTACAMADMIEDENHLNEMLMFTLLPYVSKVLGKNPYNCSKRLQRYAGEAGRCPKKDILMRWFG